MAKKSAKKARTPDGGGGPGTGFKLSGGPGAPPKASTRALTPGGGSHSALKAAGAKIVGGAPTTLTFDVVGGPGTTFPIKGDKTVTRIAAQVVNGKVVLTLS